MGRKRKPKKLTTEFVRRVSPPDDGRDEYFDALLPGFALRVTSNGAKSFCCFYRIGGRLRRYTIGSAAKYPLEEAREMAREAFRAADRGEDMQARKRALRSARPAAPPQERSFESQAREFIKRHLSKQRSATERTAAVEQLIAAWGARLVTDIAKADVIELLDRIQDAGHDTARNRRLALIRKMFQWFLNRGTVTVNPAAGIEKLKEKSRDRVLNDDELRAVWNAAGSLPYPAGAFVKLLMLTGQRRNEVAGLQWPEIDMAAKLWTVPPERYKTDLVHLVPLAEPVAAIIKGLPKFKAAKGGVEPFALSSTAGERPLQNFADIKARLDKACGVNDWTLHDLRRTCRTRMSSLGVNSDVAERVMGHLPGGVRGIYDRHEFLDEKRAALDLWARTLLSIVNQTEDKNVVALPKGRRRKG